MRKNSIWLCVQEYSKIWNIEKSNKSELWNHLSYRGLPYHFEVIYTDQGTCQVTITQALSEGGCEGYFLFIKSWERDFYFSVGVNIAIFTVVLFFEIIMYIFFSSFLLLWMAQFFFRVLFFLGHITSLFCPSFCWN